MRFTSDEVLDARSVVYRSMPATPQFAWPLLRERLGIPVWVKHENHTPIGAFKMRGGLVYFEQLAGSANPPAAVISATRGNHGQSVGWGARKHGMQATIVVPRGMPSRMCRFALTKSSRRETRLFRASPCSERIRGPSGGLLRRASPSGTMESQSCVSLTSAVSNDGARQTGCPDATTRKDIEAAQGAQETL